MKDDFAGLDAVSQAELVRNKTVAAVELVDAALARIENINPKLNAVVAVAAKAARNQAKIVDTSAPFAGVPTLLKDLLAYPGLKTELGSRFFSGQVAAAGSPYTEALDASGLIVLGKSATSEFGLLGTTETFLSGATRNPWDVALSTGGSSGGAVAAVASGIVPVAHASDGGGSVRGPAAFCGLFGFKPSRGVTAANGIPDSMPTARLLSEHCVSRSVRDSEVWLAATAQPGKYDLDRPPLPRLRIGVYTIDGYGRSCEPETADAVASVAALCRDLGHDVQDCLAPQYNAQEVADAFFLMSGLGLAEMLAQLKPLLGAGYNEENLEPYTRELVSRARHAPAHAGPRALASFAQAEKDLGRAFLSGFDVLLSPTVPFTAFPLGKYDPAKDPEALFEFTAKISGFTVAASIAGWPAMSVPLRRSPAGLPIGVHFSTRRGGDKLLMSLAYELEEAAPWKHIWPAVNALRA